MRLTRSKYLFFQALLTCGFLDFAIFDDIIKNILIFLSILWSILGIVKFYTNPRKKYFWLIAFLFFCLISNLIYSIVAQNQGAFPTILAMRDIIAFTFILISLLFVKPEEKDFEIVMKQLTFLAFILAFVVLLFPGLYASPRIIDIFEAEKLKGSFDIIPVWPGSCCVVLYFYYLLGNVTIHRRKQDLILLTAALVYIVLMQNRSTLICALPFYLFALLHTRSKGKWVIISLIVLIGIPLSVSIFQNLIEETQLQLENPNYNRWNALTFFLIEEQYDIFNTLFGHGVPCAGSSHLSSMLYEQETRLVFISDIGIIGTFYIYGLCLTGFLYYFIFKGVRKNNQLYIRLYSIWLLLVPTIHSLGLGSMSDNFRIALFIFLVISNNRQMVKSIKMQMATSSV